VIIGGGVHIGRLSFIGLGTRVNDHLEIGSNTIVGSGSVIIDNLPDHVMAVGIPAKIIKKI
jgi:acetyltransferase-like isoleucine patch superfamily enzyme